MALKIYKDGNPFTGVIGRTTEESHRQLGRRHPDRRKVHPMCSSSCWTTSVTASYPVSVGW